MASLTMEFRHITILYGNDGEGWCNHLAGKCRRPGLNVRVETLNVESLPYQNPPELLVALQESYVTLLLLTAGMTDYMEAEAEWMSGVFKRCDEGVNTVLAVPCHVELDDALSMFQEGRYDMANWDVIEVEIDGSNINDIISKAMHWVDGNKQRRKDKLMVEESLLYTSGFCEMFPTSIQKRGERIAVIFTCPIEGDVTMEIKRREKMMEMVNPYCAVCNIPDIPFGSHTVAILLDGEVKAKFKLRYKPFTPDSLSSLMKTFNVNTREEIDTLLATKYNDSVCNDPQLKRIEEEQSQQTTKSKSKSKYPSLIHWAAANGLQELCSQMMMSPGANSTCGILNCDQHNAADLARVHGYTELEEYISDYLDTELYIQACNLYVQSGGFVDDVIYEDSVGPMAGPPPVPTRPCYRSNSESGTRTPPPQLPPKRASSVKVSSTQKPIASSSADLPPPSPVNLSEAAVGCRSQNELIDIMEDFKDGNFSMSEVEMLFSSWKMRYRSGKAVSFKQKQKMLGDFRTDNKDHFSKMRRQPSSIQEEEELLSISEPIVPRKTDVGVSSKRTKDVSSVRRNTGNTDSSSSRSSADSGRGSSWADGERNSKRKSCAQIFTELTENLAEDDELASRPPPLPPPRQQTRPQSQKTKVYTKKKPISD